MTPLLRLGLDMLLPKDPGLRDRLRPLTDLVSRFVDDFVVRPFFGKHPEIARALDSAQLTAFAARCRPRIRRALVPRSVFGISTSQVGFLSKFAGLGPPPPFVGSSRANPFPSRSAPTFSGAGG